MRGARSAARNRPKSSAPTALFCPGRCRRAASLRPCTRRRSRRRPHQRSRRSRLIDLLTAAEARTGAACPARGLCQRSCPDSLRPHDRSRNRNRQADRRILSCRVNSYTNISIEQASEHAHARNEERELRPSPSAIAGRVARVPRPPRREFIRDLRAELVSLQRRPARRFRKPRSRFPTASAGRRFARQS